ncbi:hypothetical protein X965_09430 [Morganella sp. EGD-HP17]|nr:hypothetical protein X965_09430 [Morganella sp. EGD-HP17]
MKNLGSNKNAVRQLVMLNCMQKAELVLQS